MARSRTQERLERNCSGTHLKEPEFPPCFVLGYLQRPHVDSIGRFVIAAYLYPVRNSFAHFVCAKIADELKFFQAKSLKLVFSD